MRSFRIGKMFDIRVDSSWVFIGDSAKEKERDAPGCRDVTRWLELAWKPKIAGTGAGTRLRTVFRDATTHRDGGRPTPNRGVDHAA
jgi:hypothetical protein